MKNVASLSLIALTMACTSRPAQSASFFVSDAFVAIGNGTNPPEAGNVGAPANGAAFNYVARERQNPGQADRRAVTFLNFDTSSLTVSEVNSPGFSATFSIEHVGHLNNLNSGFDLSIGRNIEGDWDSTTNLPLFEWAATSENQTVILERADTVPNSQSLSLDVTPIVQGWVNGTLNDQGVVLFGTRAPANDGNDVFSQASYLANAEINTSVVPEPSSLTLAGLGVFGFLARRRR